MYQGITSLETGAIHAMLSAVHQLSQHLREKVTPRVLKWKVQPVPDQVLSNAVVDLAGLVDRCTPEVLPPHGLMRDSITQ